MKTVVVGLCALALAFATPARANWGAEAGGSVGTGAFRAFGTSQVEMQHEELRISLYRDHAHVLVKYVMKNPGAATDVRAGFPSLVMWSPDKKYTEVSDYHITVDSVPALYKIEAGAIGNWRLLFSKQFLDKYEPGDSEPIPNDVPDCQGCLLWWFASTVHFAPNQTRHVTIEYESKYQSSDGGFSDDIDYDSDWFRYILSSADTWRGPIQSGHVVIEAVTADADVLQISPAKRFVRRGNIFEWDFTNLRPSEADNLQVRVTAPFYTIYNYRGEHSWYSFEGERYYFDFLPQNVTASSERRGYPASNIATDYERTAWVAEKPGANNQSITITLPTPERVEELGIVPGYAKTKEIYFENNRIKDLEIVLNGSYTVSATLPDEYISYLPASKKGFQWIPLGKYDGEVKTIELRIKSVYRGNRYNDTCVGKVVLRKRLLTKPDPPRAG